MSTCCFFNVADMRAATVNLVQCSFSYEISFCARLQTVNNKTFLLLFSILFWNQSTLVLAEKSCKSYFYEDNYPSQTLFAVLALITFDWRWRGAGKVLSPKEIALLKILAVHTWSLVKISTCSRMTNNWNFSCSTTNLIQLRGLMHRKKKHWKLPDCLNLLP